MKLEVRHLLLGLAFGCIGQAAAALGFGAMPDAAVLGHPLDLRIPLRLEPDEEIAPDCVGATVHFGDQLQQQGTTTARIEPARPGVTDRVLRVLTTTRVSEPVVTVEVFAGCAARITRNFTLFADPPLFEAPTQVAPSAAPAGEAVAAQSAPSPAADRLAPSAGQPAAKPPRPRPVKRVRPRPTTPAPTAAAPTTASPVPQRAPSAAPQEAATSRLKLATLEAGAVPAAAAASEPALAVAAAEAAASAASAMAAAASARAAELEASSSRLRSDAARAEQTITELRSRLQQVEGRRSDSPLVYGLGGLTLLLAALLFWMWRQREHEREASAWLEQAAANPRPGTPEGAAATAEAVAFAPRSAPAPLSETGGFADTRAASRVGVASRPGGLGGPVSAPAPLAVERREVSVEELIDLEQQAEFFIVLGQDEAAIDLLMGHLRSASDTSPLPYLKLLEICKRRGDRKEYERLRERFNSRFATRAPEWETDLQSGLTLEDYPAVVGRLQGLWSQPQRAMEVLQATLLRAASDTDTQADSFDLPAYRELMLLYSIARDLSESGPSGVPVDVLLPLDEPEGASAPPVFERLVATTSLEAQPSVHKPLTVDVPLDDTPPPPAEPR